jgi:hypothetical protein
MMNLLVGPTHRSVVVPAVGFFSLGIQIDSIQKSIKYCVRHNREKVND